MHALFQISPKTEQQWDKIIFEIGLFDPWNLCYGQNHIRSLWMICYPKTLPVGRILRNNFMIWYGRDMIRKMLRVCKVLIALYNLSSIVYPLLSIVYLSLLFFTLWQIFVNLLSRPTCGGFVILNILLFNENVNKTLQ